MNRGLPSCSFFPLPHCLSSSLHSLFPIRAHPGGRGEITHCRTLEMTETEPLSSRRCAPTAAFTERREIARGVFSFAGGFADFCQCRRRAETERVRACGSAGPKRPGCLFTGRTRPGNQLSAPCLCQSIIGLLIFLLLRHRVSRQQMRVSERVSGGQRSV